MLHRSSSVLTAILALALASCNGGAAQEQAVAAEEQAEKPRLGLFTTLPIYWGETHDFSAMIDGGGEADWVRAELESKFELVPLDTLEAEALEGLDRVLLAQPRPLAPSENVAFDQYLSEGGRAVIMADPMLTRHSEYHIGDRRRPQDTVLLSPIFNRLGVELVFDDRQPEGERVVSHDGNDYPVNLAGNFERKDSGNSDRSCAVIWEGLSADCTAGSGEAFLYADAALLDWDAGEPVPDSRKKALWSILQRLGSTGDGAAGN